MNPLHKRFLVTAFSVSEAWWHKQNQPPCTQLLPNLMTLTLFSASNTTAKHLISKKKHVHPCIQCLVYYKFVHSGLFFSCWNSQNVGWKSFLPLCMHKAQTKWGLQSLGASGISNNNKNTDIYINFKKLERH